MEGSTFFVRFICIEPCDKSCARHGFRDWEMEGTPLTPQLLREHDSIDFRLAPKINPKLPMDSIAENNNVIVTSRQNKTICVFHIYNKEQKRAIIKTKIKEL